jgi:hypothetical protein
MKLLGIIIMGFNKTDQLLIKFFAFVRYWGGGGGEYDETMHPQFIDFKKTGD